ncbi:MAG: PilN domain-containing protein [Phycisphaerales bacterium]|nr:MAG: PilN domain-containing protein [Phycisphaerales bacterium]
MVGVNLIPENVRLAQWRRRRLKRWSIAILLALAILALPLTVDWVQRVQAAELRTQHDQLQIELATIRTELRALTSQANEALMQLERAHALRSKRAWSAMFALIEKGMPEGAWLVSMATDPATPPSGGGHKTEVRDRDTATEEQPAIVVIEAPRKLRMAGFAIDAAQPHEFVTNLKDSKVFTNIMLELLRTEPVLDGSYFRFELICEW